MSTPAPATASVTPILKRSVCEHCEHPVSPRAAMCPQCGHPFGAGLRVALRGLDVPFFMLMEFMVKAALAAIPAAVIVSIMLASLFAMVSGLLTFR